VIELREVSHSYRSERGATITITHALDGVDLTVPERQFVSVVGPSGCGKTTLLRLIAGLIEPSAGQVLVDGAPIGGPGRDRAVVFQDSALYPWRTVAANVRFGLEISGLASGVEADEVVARHLELVGLSEFASHYPDELSGGMQQRVGVARALAVSPQNLLMDEPFGALDAITRSRLGGELLRIWERDRRTVVFVTHSLDEALTLSDRVVLLRDGGVFADTEVGLPRPRDPNTVMEEPEFLELRRTLRELL
jgi:ABC-type nitrate/sulfonate/bicarbonate transport system ATPase subunit